jgi:hypothetical protein
MRSGRFARRPASTTRSSNSREPSGRTRDARERLGCERQRSLGRSGRVEHLATLERGRRGSDQKAHAPCRLGLFPCPGFCQKPLVQVEWRRAFRVRDQVRDRVQHRPSVRRGSSIG